ncbi:MAG TPA: ABC transporter ATP-binding protein [Fimbriimonadales bacterium]|jgi:ABC-2 type transport system ATP-binding protein|nr:ABC transporter ATP-binding protein [Fimbriimonadales bacterium]
MLKVDRLAKTYRKIRAVDSVSFQVNPGEIVGLLGPNGAGKTTTLRCIAGILRPTEGTILIEGHDVVTDSKAAKTSLAFVPETPSLYELLTVREHLKFVALCFGRGEDFDRRCDSLLEKYDLRDKADDYVATLSKGMRQKLATACALIHDAKVMLLDEPLIGIDPRGVHEFKMELLRQRDDGRAILISTHLLDTAERLCDRVIILANGRNVAEGTMDELRTGSNMQGATLEDLFLRLTQEPETVAFDLTRK